MTKNKKVLLVISDRGGDENIIGIFDSVPEIKKIIKEMLSFTYKNLPLKIKRGTKFSKDCSISLVDEDEQEEVCITIEPFILNKYMGI